MTPLRLLIYLQSLCQQQTPLTMAQIKVRIADVRSSALVNPDSPERGHDVAWYCDLCTAFIVIRETAVPPWSSADIKAQLLGSLTGIIPG
jgi:hypothetical protein